MKYKINRDFADKYKGKCGEGLSLELEYSLRKRDYADDLIQIRDGKAEDIDGIISILLEYGVLEEVDSEEEDSEEDSEDDYTSAEGLLKSSWFTRLKEAEEELLSALPALKYLDRVILEVNGQKNLYIFSAPAPDKRTAENLLSKCLEHVSKRNKKVKEESDTKGSLIKFMCDSIGLSVDELRSKTETV